MGTVFSALKTKSMNQFFGFKEYGITGSSSFFTSVLIYSLSQTRPFLLRPERKISGLRFTPTCFPLSHIGSILEVSLPLLQCQEFFFFPQMVKILGICSSITRWGRGVSTSNYRRQARSAHLWAKLWGNPFPLLVPGHVPASHWTTPNRVEGSPLGLQSLPATPLASGPPNPPLRTYLSPSAPQLPAATPRIPSPRSSGGVPFSNPLPHNGHTRRLTPSSTVTLLRFLSSARLQPSLAPFPMKEGHTPKLAALNSPEARAGVAAAAREHGPSGVVMVSCTSRLLLQV